MTNNVQNIDEAAISKPEFTIVGIGASAGGLEALQRFFDATPTNSGLAFVVVMHLSPEHQSHLPALLQSRTDMPVIQVTEIMKIEPNHVYVIPPNRNLSMIDTHLRVTPLEESRRHRTPIDYFLRTLARTHGPKAIGIILSGTGSDGSVGLRHIKEAEGLTVAQDPADAAYESMPQNAIATGQVDMILAAAEIPSRLVDYTRSTPRLHVAEDSDKIPESEQEVLQKIFVQLRSHTSHDFSRYKRSSVMRRIRRRMQMHQIEELADYLNRLRKNKVEVEALFHDLLITVTNFFRDPEVFAALETDVIPRLFTNKNAEDSIRVWVIGCATGEEAYSIAILLLEYVGRQAARMPTIQIFASDISEEALARAREGFYPAAIAADVSPERLDRFFIQEKDGYRVRAEVRELILFAPHNLLKDPPFSRIDFISCRNLLIYLKRDIQHQIVEIFHYALHPNGYLLLGPAESINGLELFREFDKSHSFFQRQSVGSAEPRLPPFPFSPPTRVNYGRSLVKDSRREIASYGTLHQQIVERYAPPSMLVNSDYNIVHLSQNAGRYLHQPGGEPTSNALKCVRPELRVEMTTALFAAFENNRASRSSPTRLLLDGELRNVNLVVQPATDPDLQDFVLVIFEETAVSTDTDLEDVPLQKSNLIIRELEEDLAQNKKRLQRALEEFETSKEEMRASNEELQSMNEELRSTAEELETSKEELQSINEELVTVNQENKNKVEELSHLASDLQNLLTATDVATLFLDRQLRIQRFTPRIGELFNILATDRGRPLSDLTHKLGYDNLLADVRQVLQSLLPIEREVQGDNGRWYLMGLRPYRTIDDHINGVVITFVDISVLRRAEQELWESQEYYGLMVEGIKEYAIFMLDQAGHIATWNEGGVRTFGYRDEAAIGHPVSLIFTPEDRAAGVVEAELETARQTGNANDDRWLLRQDGSRFWATGITTALYDEGGEPRGFVKLLRDNTWRKEAEDALQKSEEELRQLNETLEDQVVARTTQVKLLAAELLAAEQKVRQDIAQVLHDDLQQILYSARMQIQALMSDLSSQSKTAVGPTLKLVENIIERSFIVTRQLASELTPPIIREPNFAETLRWLNNNMQELHGLKLSLQTNGDLTIASEEMRHFLFHIVRELLFNVVKHAGVAEAHVSVTRDANALEIEIADDGHGFDVAAIMAAPPASGGLGLPQIRRRIEFWDGRFDITTAPDAGTKISIIIPLDAELQDDN